jgi:putative ABC transport system substrate-binding protein
MRRRKFIAALGSAAVCSVSWPLAARAQERVRRVGVLMGYAEHDPEAKVRLAAFVQGLAWLGWNPARNLAMDIRWTAGDVNKAAAFAKELVGLKPEVILANTTPVSAALRRETQSIPLVFVVVSDPVGSGFVQSLPNPGGNMTGFVNLEASLVGKWVELLKEIAPRITKVAVMFNPQTAPYAEYYLKPLQTAAPLLGLTTAIAPVRSIPDIEAAIAVLGREPNSGLVAMTDSFMTVHRQAVIDSTARHKVPAISFVNVVAREGGLISYGVDISDLFLRSAAYVDRILRGAKPAELPVQNPVKFELTINLKTAKALGLTVPPTLLARADEVID